MAFCDIRFTWNQRERLHRYVMLGVLVSLVIGMCLFFSGLFVSFTMATRLKLDERNLFEHVFKTLTIYGLYVFVHNLMGLKLCYNYFHYAEGAWMNLRLFVWSLLGSFVVLVGCFMASICFSTAERLAVQFREDLVEGMKRYLTDATWKKRIDKMQIEMQCCGIESSDDWHMTYWLQREFLALDSPDILRYAKLDGRVTPPVVPWSCCRIDVKGPCYHDPLQLPNPEQNSTYESLNARGCLTAMKTVLNGTLYSAAVLIAFLFVLQMNSVKDMTTLSGLDEGDWHYYSEITIREFFDNPNYTTLTVYYVNNLLTVSLYFPIIPVHELTYFVREPQEILRAETFRDRVLFGTMNSKVESHVLTVTQNVLAPIFLEIETWPDNTCVKADFYANMDTFLCNLTDLTYKMLGLTVIYVPREGSNLSDEASADKELVKRLEGVVAHWTTQIRIALSDQEQATPNELLCLQDEYDFWLYRHDNLCGLHYQLQNQTVKRIADFLFSTHSTYVRQFLALKDEIEHGVKEARSNIDFLRILVDPSKDLDKCTELSAIEEHLMDIVHLFRTIWLNSPYYNCHERIENLFKALSNQIIILCRNYVDLNKLFTGNSQKFMEKFYECIDACENYKELYDKIAHAHNSLTNVPWDLNRDNIFQHIDIFIGRCYDMIEICQAMMDFARMDETALSSKPMFGGTKGEERERVCQKIERLFHEALEKIEQNSSKIFDVHHSTWHDEMFAFRNEMKDLEVIIENLVASVFVNLNNVQEGVEDLQAFYSYMNREKLKVLFDAKTAEIWKLFGDDIQQTKQEVLDEREEYLSITPYYAGRALNLLLKGARLQSTREVLEQAMWMPYCSLSEDLYYQHDLLKKSIGDLVADIHSRWIHEVGENPRARLDRFLMRRSDPKSGLLECNIDPNILKVCRETGFWIALKFTIPVHIQIVYDKYIFLFFFSYRVDKVRAKRKRIYRVFAALSMTERELFRELIYQLDRKINPGLNRLTWNTEYVDAYIEDCFNQTANLQEFIDVYKESNQEIVRICEKICDTPMINIKPNHTYSLQELQEEFIKVRYEV
ncbi:Dynein-1-beta heavy chain, flagellar inner arm I1 complex [Habropoda laboriosa]|uniref:Dynein-1-beta heavy chain, flagellar inner arm I1 complex n=1 Tax=Habropoda laboriosa TaxID=597456 RepID=A0A0L7RJF9_9HYME|nr:Dynein-1-beta heavy chain, flagellar inner arm I1 complex [Habropoda laboriosa]